MRWARRRAPGRANPASGRRRPRRAGPTPGLSSLRGSDGGVYARHLAHYRLDLADQRVGRRRLVIVAVDLDGGGGVDLGSRRLAGDLGKVLAAVDAIGNLADGAGFAGEFDSPSGVEEAGAGLAGLDVGAEQRPLETAESIDGFVGDAQGRRTRPRRIVLVLRAVENRHHGVIGRDGADVDEVGNGRPERALEFTAGRAQEVLVERHHGLRVAGPRLGDQLARRDPHRVALAGGAALLFVAGGPVDDADQKQYDERGAGDLDESAGFAGTGLQVVSRGAFGFVGHGFADPSMLACPAVGQ